jgi:hypothetical protein
VPGRGGGLESAPWDVHAHSVAKLNGASIARLAVLLIGVAKLDLGGHPSPASECTYPSADYGICTDNSALKWELAIVGAILVGVANLVARRRHASQAV